MKTLKNLFLLFCFFNVISFAQTITTEEIVKNIKSKAMEVNDYIVDVDANINLQALRVPKAKIKVYFKQPDKFYYDTENSALLPKSGFNVNLSNLIDDTFDMKIIKEETLDNTQVYILELFPRYKDTEELYTKTYMWVDKKNWVIKKMFNETSNMLKMTVDFSYSYFDNKYYMPSLVKYSIEPLFAPEEDASDNRPTNSNQQQQKRGIRRGFMGEGEITLILKNYIINSNFSDDIFKSKNEK